MSEPIAETFVTITPLVDEAKFKADTERQIQSATSGIKAQVDTSGLRQEFKKASAEAAQALSQLTLLDEKSLVGKASIEEATAARTAYTQAALRAAKADVELKIATGLQSDTFASSAALLRQHRDLMLRDAEATELNTRAQLRNVGVGPGGPPGGPPRGPRTGRDAIRGVIAGEGFGIASIAKIGAAGLAIGAVFQGLQHLTEALKVTGDEAFTTEGKFRNFGAELLSGDVVGGIMALNAEAPSAAKQLKAMGADANTTSVDLRNFAFRTAESAEKADTAAKAYERLGVSGGAMGDAIRKAAAEMRDASEDAQALANAADAAAQAVIDVNAAVAAVGGNDAAAFGERSGRFGRGTGAAAREGQQPGAGVTNNFDSTDTAANADAIERERVARTATLKDDLALAKQHLREDEKIQAEAAKIGNVEGAKERQVRIEAGRTEVAKIERQIAADAARAAADAAAKAKRAADERATARASALRESLDLKEGNLQIALDDADTVSEQRKALLRLVAFEREKAANQALTLKERQAARAAEKAYLRDVSELNKQQLADALGVRKQNLENAITAAKLTPGKGDDDRANARFLQFLKDEVKRAKGNAAAVAAAKAELLQFQVSLKEEDGGGGGFSLNDLFKSAVDQFTTFGSNIAGRDGVLSGQDARASLGREIINSPGMGTQRAQLTESQRQTQLLTSIDRKIGGGKDKLASGRATPEALSASGHPAQARLAAEYSYGAG